MSSRIQNAIAAILLLAIPFIAGLILEQSAKEVILICQESNC